MMIEVSTAIDGDNFFPALCRLIGKMFCERFVPPGGIEEAVKVKKFHPPSNHLGFFLQPLPSSFFGMLLPLKGKQKCF
jgi:hypothetical protein